MKKVCHFYWGGGALSYLQYLSIATFKKHNPDWTVNLFKPSEPEALSPTWPTGEQSQSYEGRDYLAQAEALCTVIEADFTDHGLAKPRHEVQRSDVLRWHILYEHGGVWSDIDILYIKPIPNMSCDIALTYHTDPYIGFFMAKPKQPLFEFLYTTAKDNIRRNMDDLYQSLGGDIFRYHFGSHAEVCARFPDSNIVNLDMDFVYPYSAEQIPEMFFGDNDWITDSTVGLHWYNGSTAAKQYQNNLTEFSNNKSIISRKIKECSPSLPPSIPVA